MAMVKITVVRVRKPKEQDINDELQWISRSLGLFSERDKEKSCYRIFLALLKEHKPMSSEDLADFTNLSRATVLHHMNKLIESGVVVSEHERYLLRDDVDKLIDDIEADIISTLNEVRKTTRHIKHVLDR